MTEKKHIVISIKFGCPECGNVLELLAQEEIPERELNDEHDYIEAPARRGGPHEVRPVEDEEEESGGLFSRPTSLDSVKDKVLKKKKNRGYR